MNGWIQNISGVIPHTNKSVDITLDGKNLIITGANGSGKTSFLKAIYEKVDLLIAQKRGADLPQIKKNLSTWQTNLNNTQKGTSQFNNLNRHISTSRNQIDALEKDIVTQIPDSINFSALYDDRKAVVRFFEERHFSEIAPATTAKGLSQEEDNAMRQPLTQKFGNNLEQHLVNLANRRQWAFSKDNDLAKVKEIDDWFMLFEQQLRRLFEDESVRLEIGSNTLKYKIVQDAKPPYDFQTLSAGYRAIFDIYAELIMRTEYFKIVPSELTGVVFIDEIDSHLHVSLQRLILPFFTESFPKIQFIVTTHSPFVLMSAQGAVIFDLAGNEPVTDDLSYYTYSAVMKGLWNVNPIPIRLEKDIREIAEIVKSKERDIERLNQLVLKISINEENLDYQSKAFLALGKEVLMEEKQKCGQ